MASIPFEIQMKAGSSLSGLLFIEDEFLVFDLPARKKGIFRRKPAEKIKVELALVDHLHVVPGIFWDHLYVVPRRSDLLRAIPGDHKGEIKMKIAKRHREQAEKMVSDALSHLAKRDREH